MFCTSQVINKKTIQITHNFDHDPPTLEFEVDLSTALSFDPDTVIVRNVVDNTNVVETPNIQIAFEPTTASANCTLSNGDLTLTKANDSLVGGCFGDITFTQDDEIDIEITQDSNTNNKRLIYGIASTDLTDPADGIGMATSYYCMRRASDGIFTSEDSHTIFSNFRTSPQRMVLSGGKIGFYYLNNGDWLLNHSALIDVNDGTYNFVVQDNNTAAGGFVVSIVSNVSTYIDTTNTIIYVTSNMTETGNNFFTPNSTTNIGSVISTYKYDDGVNYYNVNLEYTLLDSFSPNKIMGFKIFHLKPEDGDALFFEDLNDGSITLELEFIQYAHVL